MLVFCPTRKGVFTFFTRVVCPFAEYRTGVLSTAEQLMKDYEKAAQSKQTLPWSQSRR